MPMLPIFTLLAMKSAIRTSETNNLNLKMGVHYIQEKGGNRT